MPLDETEDYLTPDEVESFIRSEKLSKADAASFRREMDIDRTRILLARGRATPGILGRVGAVTGPAISGIYNAADTAFLGLPGRALSAGAAALDPRELPFGEKYDLARSRERTAAGARPIAQTVGQIGGYILPGPAKGIQELGFNALGRPLAQLAVRTFDRGSRLSSGLLQIGSALGGGIGASAALEGAQFGADKLASAVTGGTSETSIDDAVETVLDPKSLIISGALGAAGAGLQQTARTRTNIEAMDRARRIRTVAPDLELPPGFYRTTNGIYQGLENMASKTPLGRSRMARILDRGFVQPLRQWVNQVRGIAPLADDVVGSQNATAARIRRQIGDTDVSPSGEVTEIAGSRLMQRRGVTSRLAAERGTIMPATALNAVEDAVRVVRRDALGMGPAGRADLFSGEFGNALRRVRETLGQTRRTERLIAAGRPVSRNAIRMNVNMADKLRRELDAISDWPQRGPLAQIAGRPSDDQIRWARDLRTAIRRSETITSPLVDQTLSRIAALRRAETSLEGLVGPVAENRSSAAVVDALFSDTGNFISRWRTLVHTNQDQVADHARGAYLARFIESIYQDATPRLRASDRVGRLFSGSGPFNARNFDEVIGDPGLRQQVTEWAWVNDQLRQHVLKAEGSETFRRAFDARIVNESLSFFQELAEYAAGMRHDLSFGRRALIQGAGWLAFTSGLLNSNRTRFLGTASIGQVARKGATGVPFGISDAATGDLARLRVAPLVSQLRTQQQGQEQAPEDAAARFGAAP